MISTTRITTSEVRKYNKNRIFRLIYNSNSISRQEIADKLGLSLPTINQNIKLLKEEGLILLEGNFDSTGGRKAQMITVNAAARYAVSVNICPLEIRTSLIDLNGEIKDEISLKTEFATDSEYGVKVSELVENVIKANHIPKDNLLGVGITMPGIFNEDNSMIIFSPPLKVKNYKTENITKHIQYDYIVQNDARANAFADYWYSHKNENTVREELEEKLYLMVSDGVGGACVSNNTIMKGEHNRYGEFGHMTLYPGGKKCMCGRNGCLEGYVSTKNISTDIGMTLDEFFEKVEEKDEKCTRLFDEYLDNLTTGINNLYVIFDRDVIIGGVMSRYLTGYVEDIKARLVSKFSFDTDGSYFSLSQCTSKRADTGAAIMFLTNYINSI